MECGKENLKRYLEMEKILNRFFELFDYCLTDCVRPHLRQNGNKPFAACCKDRYHTVYDIEAPAYDLLREARYALYGRPESVQNSSLISPCEYHTDTGCLLSTHKSPICLAFMCRKSIDALREKHGIFTYDYLGFNYALEWILTGDMKGDAYLEFKESCLEMVKTMEAINL